MDKDDTINGVNLTLEELEELAAEIREVLIHNGGLTMSEYIKRASEITQLELGHRMAKAFCLEPKIEAYFPDEVYKVLHDRFLAAKHFFFNEYDINFIRCHSPKGTKWIAERMYAHPDSIRVAAQKYEISILNNFYNYTPQTIEFIKKHFEKGPKWLSDRLNISVDSIRNRAKRMGLETVDIHRFTEAEDIIIKKNYMRGTSWLAKKLNRNRSSIYHRTKSMGLKVPYICKNKMVHKFTKEDDDFIKSNADKGSLWISDKLHVVARSVQDRALLKHIKLAKPRRKYSESDDKFIRENIKKGIAFIASRMRVTTGAISRRISEWGLKCPAKST